MRVPALPLGARGRAQGKNLRPLGPGVTVGTLNEVSQKAVTVRQTADIR